MMMSVAPSRYRASLATVLGSTRADLEAVEVTGLSLDSRHIGGGELFLAVSGDLHDGRQFIEQAVANGASAVVAEAPVGGFVDDLSVPLVEVPELGQEVGQIAARFYRQPSHAMTVVGVTGTNGKTTTTRLVAQLERLLGRSCGVVGTLGASLTDEVTESINTTPDAVSLQRQLAQWRDEGVEHVAMEVSSHALVQGRVGGIDFDTAVFTNLTRDHLDYHGSMASYGQAKMQLFRQPGLRHALVNLDDEVGALFAVAAGADTAVHGYTIAGVKGADVAVTDLEFHDGGVRATLSSPWGSGHIDSPLIGSFNIANLVAAISALAVGGEDLGAILAAVPRLQSVPGRMQMIPNRHQLQVVVDYAHTPDALEQLLLALRPHVPGKLVCVFGCGGDRDAGKRSVMGRIACEFSDLAYVTSDNPRSEDPYAIMQDIEAGCTGDYVLIEDRAVAIAESLAAADAGDCVVIAGKGHEDYQIVEGQRLHFSDEQQARLALDRRVVQ